MGESKGIKGAWEESIALRFVVMESAFFMQIIIHESVDVVEAYTLTEEKKISLFVGQERNELLMDEQEDLFLAFQCQNIGGEEHLADGGESGSYGQVLIVCHTVEQYAQHVFDSLHLLLFCEVHFTHAKLDERF